MREKILNPIFSLHATYFKSCQFVPTRNFITNNFIKIKNFKLRNCVRDHF